MDSCRALWLSTVVLGVACSAQAAPATFTGRLTIYDSGGSGAFGSWAVSSAGTASYDPGSQAFTLPSSAFVRDSYTPVGFTANASPNSIYVIGQIVNQASGAGSFGPSPGGFGGVMAANRNQILNLGIVPLPNIFSSFILPTAIGVSTTQSEMVAILTNAVSVEIIGKGWTTGTVSVDDSPTFSIPGSVRTLTTVSGTNQLGAQGGRSRWCRRIGCGSGAPRPTSARATRPCSSTSPWPSPEACRWWASRWPCVCSLRSDGREASSSR